MKAPVRHAVTRTLAAAGHDVHEAADGVSGLSLWREAGSRGDDIAIPNMSGFALIAAIRGEGAAVPVVAISGSLVVSDLEVIRQATSLGQWSSSQNHSRGTS
jgi:CheY-like chemotaxis protein